MAILFIALCLAAGIVFLLYEAPLLASGLTITAILWGATGSLFGWPGFRPPPKPNECKRCRYDLTGNTSGVCPECGVVISISV